MTKNHCPDTQKQKYTTISNIGLFDKIIAVSCFGKLVFQVLLL